MYDPKDWFWQVGRDASRYWSSAVAAYVTNASGNRVTRIADEIELYDVLAKQGLQAKAPQGPFSAGDVRAALLRIDAVVTGAAADSQQLGDAAAIIGFDLPQILS